MPRDLILGKLDPDLACAIALGLVEHNFIVANLEAITLHDEDFQTLGQQRDWLTDEDPLDVATHDYLAARREALFAGHHGEGDNAWAAAAAIGTREEANRRAVEAREAGRAILEERRVLESARAAGMTVFGDSGRPSH
ncbi:MAG: hypothetical protein ACJ8FY_23515 [Gemmataceae bacterium]